MKRGYFALYRKLQDHPFWKEKRKFSKAEAWIDILWEAQHEKEPQKVMFGMQVLICNYGESLKSVRTWAKRWWWGETKVHRFLKLLKNMDQIETVNETVTTRLIVLNYSQYDPKNKKNETQPTDEIKHIENTSKTQAVTDKNDKNVMNVNNKEVIKNIVVYLNQKTGKSFKYTSKETQRLIQARLNSGFTENDFFTVIDNKVAKWFCDPKMVEYLRPQTLFGTKFESYLQDMPHPLHGKVSETTIKNIQVLENWRPKDEE